MFNSKILQEEIMTDIPEVVTTANSAVETQPPAMIETFQPIETQPVLPATGEAPVSSSDAGEIPIATDSTLVTTQNVVVNTAIPTLPTFTSANAGIEIQQTTLASGVFTTAAGAAGSQPVPTKSIEIEIKTPSVGEVVDETTIIQSTAGTFGADTVAPSNSPTSSSILPPVPDQTTEEQPPHVFSDTINVACGTTSDEIVFQTSEYKSVSAEWNIATSDGCDIRIEFTQLK